MSTPITTHVPCITCHYNLHTQPTNARCPECGTSVEKSLSPKRLILQPPPVLQRLRRSIRFCCLLVIASLIGRGTWAGITSLPGTSDLQWLYWSNFAFTLASWVAWPIACWWMTAVPCISRSTKILMRLSAILAMLLFAGGMLGHLLRGAVTVTREHIWSIILPGSLTLCGAILLELCVAVYLGAMLRRSRRNGLAIHTWLVGGTRAVFFTLSYLVSSYLLWMASTDTGSLGHFGRFIQVLSFTKWGTVGLLAWYLVALLLAWRAFAQLHRQALTLHPTPTATPVPPPPTHPITT